MPNKKFEKEELENIIKDYQNGMCPKDLGIKYLRNDATIIDKLKSLKIFIPSTNRWTKMETNYLKDNYAQKSWEEILTVLSRHTKESIVTKAYKLKIRKENHFWSNEDIKILKDNYNDKIPIEQLVILLHNRFSPEAIYAKASKLHIKIVESWTENEINILKKHYNNLPINEIMILLPNRKRENINKFANNLGLVSIVTWKDEDKQFIVDNWNTMSDYELSEQLHRTFRSIKAMRNQLGILRIVEAGVYNSLSEYIRKRNKQWKKDSAKNCGFKCILTNKRFQAIHHIYGMNLILNRTLEILNIDIKNNFNDYTQEELDLILNKFLAIQSTYPLGVCLTKELHKMFHDKYGYGNNIPEQFNEFVDDYKNGQYNSN